MTKPFDALGYEEIVAAVEAFWLANAVLPTALARP